MRVVFALFAVSGFTGLVYESVWSHYLKLFLGSAAFAQSFVLGAFMGGMALGAWLTSRRSAGQRNLLALYGWIEALIGLAALAFHPVFVSITDASLEHVIPALGSSTLIESYKYAVCALLVVPQTVLLGMTFPLMSGAVIRRYPDDATGRPAGGHRLATLYFTNSIGAAAGALAAAFWLLGWLGMPGTLRVAGVLNLALAAVVLALARGGEASPATAAPAAGVQPARRSLVLLFLIAAAVTGTASFIYEIAWIRMLSLVLSSSFHAFELMLSAFITGLALGGLWIRKRIDRIADPVRFSGLVQIAMGLAALATLFVYQATFDWMAWALGVLQRKEASYLIFNLFSHGVAFAVMLPATFLAGMTLPLFTYVLMRGGHGERAIGQVYAANTLGAIAGVVLAVHVLVPGAGLKVAMVVGAALDIVLGAWLLRWSGAPRARAEAFVGLIAGLLAATITARAAAFSPERLVSGVYRHGTAELVGDVLYYRDGKTATIAVVAMPAGMRFISSNGKPDASIQMDPAQPRTEDEYTMTLLGALPLLYRPDARSVANIGMGSGLTTETVLAHAGVRSVDVIEIEPAMAAGSYAFHPRVDRLFRDRRVSVHFEDAKSYFARRGARYDVIVSEPSNPWVSGVASLFTAEFYRDTVRYLAPGGLFVQWLQYYELNDRLLGSMFAAMDTVFADYEVYQAGAGDLIVIAVPTGRVPIPAELPAREAGFLGMLQQIGITRREHVLARRVGNKRQLAPVFAQSAAPVNSDYRPLVQLKAPRARFLQEYADAIFDLAGAPLPVLEMLAGTEVTYLSAPAPRAGYGRYTRMVDALQLQRSIVGQSIAGADLRVFALRYPGVLCAARPDDMVLRQLHSVAADTLAYLGPEQQRALWVEPRWLGCPLVRAAPAVQERFAVYRAVAQRDARGMLQQARALLESAPRQEPEWARFLLLAAVLGAQAGGEPDEAHRLWRTHARTLLPGKTRPHERFIADWGN
ncbi:MAG: spermidine synthase [Betaproteobacteria bacterium]|nr:spermidine synthase [Betaproteobacteria bacterium]